MLVPCGNASDSGAGGERRQRELAALEAGAAEMRHFLPTLVTGLLQTPEYIG
jgi:Domain of unknown function (DUF5753)